MNKIWLIIQREYKTRVQNKRFLLVTFLMPILLVAFIAGSAYVSVSGIEHRKIAVIDPNGFIQSALKNTDQIEFNFPKDVDTNNYKDKGYTDVLILSLIHISEPTRH